MRVLVVDEDPSRQQVFRTRYVAHELVIVDALMEAIAALTHHRFDLVLLDDCLCDNQVAGNVIARYISTTIPVSKRPSEVIIHSLNPIAASLMRQILLAAKNPPRVSCQPYMHFTN